MVDVRRVPPEHVAAVHALWTDRVGDPDRETVRELYDETPELFVGAYEGDAEGGDADPTDGDVEGADYDPLDAEALVGFAAGERHDDGVELTAIGVRESHLRQGIGSRLLDAFEAAAADLGAERVGLGSAGGYVDDFYLANGYEAEKILVRPDGSVEEHRDRGFETVVEEAPDGEEKLYVPVEAHDHEFLARVREAFGDPEACYIMAKRLDGG